MMIQEVVDVQSQREASLLSPVVKASVKGKEAERCPCGEIAPIQNSSPESKENVISSELGTGQGQVEMPVDGEGGRDCCPLSIVEKRVGMKPEGRSERKKTRWRRQWEGQLEM